MKVLAGDWKENTGVLLQNDCICFVTGFLRSEDLKYTEIASLEVLDETNRSSILGKAGWGAVGALALGPLGLLAGVLGGGNKQERVVALTFKDGRRALIQMKAKHLTQLLTKTFSLLEPTAAA